MIGFAIRRVLWMLIVMFGISVLAFLIFFATPGVDPARQLAGRNPTEATVRQIKHEFGLDRPLPVRYALLMKHLVISRDLVSYSNGGAKVIPELVSAAPVTFSLVLGAAVIWVLAGVAVGVAAASLRGTIFDPLLMAFALVGISMPVFWLGEVTNLLTQSRFHSSFLFHWVPPLGYTPLAQDPGRWFEQMIIPWTVLSVGFVGLYARVLRGSLIETESEDYIRTARAKGISEWRVLVRHRLRTSLIPFVSLFGLDFAGLVAGGALLVEVVFGLPGVGLLTYQSLQSLDLPVIMATVVYAAFFITLTSAVVDVVYARLDPRIRLA